MNPMSWKLAPPVVNLIAVIFFLWLYAQRSGKIRYAINRGDGSVEFPPDLISLLGGPIIGLLPVWESFNRHGSGSILGEFTLAALLFATGAVLFSLPGTVVVASGGIEKRFWLRADKLIRWGEIAEIKDGAFAGKLTFIGSGGTKIIYSDRLADRPRFLEEIEKYLPGRLPPAKLEGSILKLQRERKSS
jgi:hypothetical protein